MQKRIKQILCAALFAAMLTTGVYAADNGAVYNRTSNSITVNCDTEENGYGIFVYILKGRLAKTDKVSNVISEDTLVYAGKIVKEFELPDNAADGVYTVVFGANAGGTEEERRFFVLKNDENTEKTGVEEVLKAPTAAEMLEKLKENNDKAYILELENADNVGQLFFDTVRALELDKKSEPSLDDLTNAYNTAGELAKMQTADSTELEKILVSNKEILGLDEDIDQYAAETAAAIIKARETGETLDSLEKEKNLVREKLALAVLNGAGNSGLYSAIEKYNDVFNVTFSSNKSRVSEYEVAKLITVKFDDVKKVGSIVNAAIDKAYENSKKPISGGNGGYVGGGSGSSGNRGGGGGYSAPSLIDRNELAKDVGENTMYSDIAGYDWAKEAIEYLAENDIMSGDGNGTFRPGDTLTREELVKLIVVALGSGTTDKADLNFSDVKDDWYKEYVETAYKNGIVKGIDDNTFGIGKPVTREDACVMISRAAEAYYRTFNKKITLVDFNDFDSVEEYAKVGVDILARANIISGFDDGTFRPKQNITRAEAAKIIYNCLINLKG